MKEITEEEYPKTREIKATSRKTTDFRKKTKQTVVIIGDSIIGGVYGNDITKSLKKKNHHVIVKSFSGAKVDQMTDYIQPTLRSAPDQVILHYGTCSLKNLEEDAIANEIVSLGTLAKSKIKKVSIS